jgi:uncharacterized membrane protein YjgN (DUF898 family)
MPRSKSFTFDGGAASYVGTGILAFVITVFTLGIFAPYGIVLRQRWKAKHTYIDGRQLAFVGLAIGLFGSWIKWWFLTLITIGIYSFWVVPRYQKWLVENTDWADQRASSA